jgi:asparagine synthase (glutamine-hydrolysing)
MCRIAGLWDLRSSNAQYDISATLNRMRDSLHYGGPDSADSYRAPDTELYLGHRRLSIIDLSEAGRQPMRLGHQLVVFNGEIYNYAEIAAELTKLGHRFNSHSDTEVLLHAFEQWGKEAVQRFRGMFAFALYNEKTKKLLLCRDRLGVKPLYWYYKEGLFMFASELKAFHEHPHFDKSICPYAVSLYLQQGYIPAPDCIYNFAHKLDPGSFLEIDGNGNFSPSSYWDVQEVYRKAEIPQASEAELTDHLEALLRDSFQLRMVADVPVGMFLSGGVDSSTVVALLQQQSGSKLKTFTIGFEHPEYNEAEHAKAIAKHLGTEHHELYCKESDFEAVLELLPEIYDEPLGDSSGIPTYLVAQMAKKEVKVSLSADGGDELFGGYTKYEVTQNFYPKIKKIPGFMRSIAAFMAAGVDPLWLERNAPRLPIIKQYKNISNKFPKFINALKAKDLLDFFNRSSSHISKEELKKLYPQWISRFDAAFSPDPKRIVSYLGMIDVLTYLEGDIMTKVDRATMRTALEGREPLLDHKIVEFALGLPDDLKIKGNSTKYLLRQVLYRHVPKEMIERPKQGFSIPVQQWLLGSLRGELEKMALDKDFISRFHLEETELKKIIGGFLSQKRFVNPHFVWFLYVLYKWGQRW